MVHHEAAHRLRGAPEHPARDPLVIQRLALAVQELDRVEGLSRPGELARTTLSVARCYAELGMHDTAEWYYRQALAATGSHKSAHLMVDALTGLAEALVFRAHACNDDADRYTFLERARDLAFEAASTASRTLGSADEAAVLVVIANVLSACGDTGDAAALLTRARGLATA